MEGAQRAPDPARDGQTQPHGEHGEHGEHGAGLWHYIVIGNFNDLTWNVLFREEEEEEEER